MIKVLGGRFSLFGIGLFCGSLIVVAIALFPAIGMTKCGPASAERRDLMFIVAALKQYAEAYGHFPEVTATGLIADEAASAKLFRILTGEDAEANPKKIAFFEARNRSPGRAAHSSGLDPASGAMLDPWGRLYRIVMDVDHDGEIAPPYSDDLGRPIRMKVIAWSLGKDGHQGTRENPTHYKGSDDVVSWQ
jgi:hypothetical protein